MAGVKELFGGKLADIAIEGTGFSGGLENAIHIIKRFGTIVLLGNPAGSTTITQGAHSQLLRKEVTINGIWNSHYDNVPINEWHYTVEMMDAGKFTCEDLISHRCSLTELPHLVDQVKNRLINICKALYSSAKD